jgi:hypothetical protein
MLRGGQAAPIGKETEMNKQRRRVPMIVGAALAAFGLGGGIAYATGGTAAPQGAPVHGTTSVVTAQLQQGSAASGASDSSKSSEQAGESATEQPGESTTESATEQSAPSDGPGGHADPAGNVDHQFNGEE